MLVALRGHADLCNQNQIFVHRNAIDLDHQQIEAGEIECHPILHAAADSATKRREAADFDSSRRRRNVSLRQPNQSGKLQGVAFLCGIITPSLAAQGE
jgi:hypothetical protein